MLILPLSPSTPKPPCADPVHLPLVDAAFTRPGGAEAQHMIETLCQRCPAWLECLDHAMRHREHGIWGGTTPNRRTAAGAPGSPTIEAQRRAS